MADLVNGLGGSAGFGENELEVGADNFSAEIFLTSIFAAGLNFFGTPYNSIYVNNNGNLTFGSPSGFTSVNFFAAGAPVIAPFAHDVDTRNSVAPVSFDAAGTSTGSNRVYWDLDPTGNGIFTVTWDDVGRFNQINTAPNAFQVQIIGQDGGNFDIVFRYEDIQYAVSGISMGFAADDGESFVALSASGNPSTAIDTDLGNTGVAGLWSFSILASNFGTSGNDALVGGAAVDLMFGRGGDDTLTGGTGADTLNGGAGKDTFVVGASSDLDALESIYGGSNAGGVDTLRLDAAGNYTAAQLDGTLNRVEVVSLNQNAATWNLTFADAAYTNSDANGDGVADGTLTVSAAVYLGSGITLVGGATTSTNELVVIGTNLRGNDSLTGGAGADVIEGGGGTDSINGGDGNDTLSGGADNDTINGGNGIDTVNYSVASGPMQVNLFTGIATGEGTDTLSFIENVMTGSGNDEITGSDADNQMQGGRQGAQMTSHEATPGDQSGPALDAQSSSSVAASRGFVLRAAPALAEADVTASISLPSALNPGPVGRHGDL